MKRFLITGGAGFIGSNLADSLLGSGHEVTVFDALLRPGAEQNRDWLRERHAQRLSIISGDVRDREMLARAVATADIIFHLAAQVAVTSSLIDPLADFETNAAGTLNLLECARKCATPPGIVYASTNKVYGRMADVAVESETRYESHEWPRGFSESQPLNPDTPYACSKAVADQYVRGYARTFGLRTVVLRLSCTYGPRQFGNEDQGWLAHFMIRALLGMPVTVYGNGKQVRDVLFVDDLVRALTWAAEKLDSVSGEVFNVGGGPDNSISVWREFGELLSELSGQTVCADYREWRPRDQRYYVTDIRKAARHLNWRPTVDMKTGIRSLWHWIGSQRGVLAGLFAPTSGGTPAPPRRSG